MFGIFSLIGAAIAGKIYVEEENAGTGIIGGILTAIAILYWISPAAVDVLIIVGGIALVILIPKAIYHWFKNVPYDDGSRMLEEKYGIKPGTEYPEIKEENIERNSEPKKWGMSFSEQMAYQNETVDDVIKRLEREEKQKELLQK